MKKLFLVMAVASLGFVACNNEGETTEKTEDSAKSTIETVTNEVNEVADSAKNVIDSVTNQVTDSATMKSN